MALEMQADHVELANTQYYAWAYLNRENLIPTKDQILNAEKKLEEFRQKVGNKMKLYFVLPDYYETRPKACMNGWGTTFLNIAADGMALPCHEARMLPDIELPNIRDHSIDWIWNKSSLFNKYRGFDWMEEPCKSCNEKEKDFGGCRCQAFLITGNSDSTDPICDKSPNHHIITQDVEKAQNKIIDKNEVQKVIKFRTDKNSLEISEKNH
jgi:pyrroloquinoline quinone biosynthesis protein E